MTREPALIVGAVVAVLATIGVMVTPEQSDAIVGGIVAVSAIVQAVVTRSQVTPSNNADR